MFKFKKSLCAVLTAAMVITLLPVDALASEIEGEIDLIESVDFEDENQEEIVLTEEVEEIDELEIVAEDEWTDVMEVSEEDGAAVETVDVEADEENGIQYNLTESEMTAKQSLADSLSYYDGKIEGIDFEAGVVIAFADSLEKAEMIAGLYDIVLVSYDCMIAEYELPEDVRVSDILYIAADMSNNYPAVLPNVYGNTVNTFESSDTYFSGASDSEEEITDDEMSLSSDIVDKTINDNFLKENNALYQWHHEVIGTPYAWESGIDGTGIKVAIVGTGINAHTDFDNYDTKVPQRYNINESSTDKAKCYDITNGNGTIMAGAIGADINSFWGIGVAPRAELINIKVNMTGYGDTDASNTAKGIMKAVDLGADIIVLGTGFDMPVPAVETAIDYAYYKGVAVFAGEAIDSVQKSLWPAAYKHTIAVGATDKNNQRAGFSAYDGNIDISAPGEAIVTCSWETDKYIGMNGPTLSAAIAAGEAALILQNKANIKTFYDKQGNLLSKTYGEKYVDALEKHMKASTISAGKGAGSGIVYLPKALGLGTITTSPTAPQIVEGSGFHVADGVLKYDFDIVDNYYDMGYGSCYYYTLDGKTPSYKNGVKDKYSFWSGDGQNIDMEINGTQKNLVIKAIAVDSHGVASPVTTKTIPINEVLQVNISAPTNYVVAGKKLNFTSAVIPNNAVTKAVKWHVSYSGSEDMAKTNNVTISTSGVFTTKTTSGAGTYEVWAESVKNPSKKSAKVSVSVEPTGYVKSITVPKNYKSNKIYRGDVDSEINLMDYIVAERIYGAVSVNDLIFTSSNPKVVAVGPTKWKGYLKGPGKATITVTDAYCAGIKATYSIEVIQDVTQISLMGNSYNKVVRGKSFNIQAVIYPENSKVKKIQNWFVQDSMYQTVDPKVIKISNGKITVSKDAPVGTYYVYAQIVNPDSTVISNSYAYEFDVISANAVSSIIPKDKTKTLYSANNVFVDTGSGENLMQGDIIFTVAGGEREIYGNVGWPNNDIFDIESSNPEILNCWGPFQYTDNGNQNEMQIGLVATGKGSGKVTVTIKALDGSGKTGKFTVNVVNPAASVKVAPAKAGTNMAVATGKTLQLKATLGDGYGKLSDKNVIWALADPTDSIYASIDKNGKITAKSTAPIAGTKQTINILATAKDGGRAYTIVPVEIYKNVGKIEVCDSYGNKAPNSFTVTGGFQYGAEFYVKIKNTGAPFNFVSGNSTNCECILNTSNPSIGMVRYSNETPVYKNGYYIYKFVGIALSDKSGSAKLTISMRDGSQNVSVTMKTKK